MNLIAKDSLMYFLFKCGQSEEGQGPDSVSPLAKLSLMKYSQFYYRFIHPGVPHNKVYIILYNIKSVKKVYLTH